MWEGVVLEDGVDRPPWGEARLRLAEISIRPSVGCSKPAISPQRVVLPGRRIEREENSEAVRGRSRRRRGRTVAVDAVKAPATGRASHGTPSPPRRPCFPQVIARRRWRCSRSPSANRARRLWVAHLPIGVFQTDLVIRRAVGVAARVGQERVALAGSGDGGDRTEPSGNVALHLADECCSHI